MCASEMSSCRLLLRGGSAAAAVVAEVGKKKERRRKMRVTELNIVCINLRKSSLFLLFGFRLVGWLGWLGGEEKVAVAVIYEGGWVGQNLWR